MTTVVAGNRHSCTLFGGQPLKATSGYLTSSSHPAQMVVGTQNCPWLIRVQPGQKVNLTLFSFYIPERDGVGLPEGGGSTAWGGADGDVTVRNSHQHLSRCLPQRLVVQERNGTLDVAVCSERRRERQVYSSETNEVNVYVHTELKGATSTLGGSLDGAVSVSFLVKYQGRGRTE